MGEKPRLQPIHISAPPVVSLDFPSSISPIMRVSIPLTKPRPPGGLLLNGCLRITWLQRWVGLCRCNCHCPLFIPPLQLLLSSSYSYSHCPPPHVCPNDLLSYPLLLSCCKLVGVLRACLYCCRCVHMCLRACLRWGFRCFLCDCAPFGLRA